MYIEDEERDGELVYELVEDEVEKGVQEYESLAVDASERCNIGIFYQHTRISIGDDATFVVQWLGAGDLKIIRATFDDKFVESVARIFVPLFQQEGKIRDYFMHRLASYRLSKNRLGVGNSEGKSYDTEHDCSQLEQQLCNRLFTKPYQRGQNVFVKLHDLYEFMHLIVKTNCIICGRLLEEGWCIPWLCGSELCSFHFSHDATCQDWTKCDPLLVEILLYATFASANSHRSTNLLYSPPSQYIGEGGEMKREQLIADLTDILSIMSPSSKDHSSPGFTWMNRSRDEFISICSCLTDEQRDLLWWVYAQPCTGVNFTHCTAQETSDVLSRTNSAQCRKSTSNCVVYRVWRSEKVNLVETKMAYHGSRLENWLSILANGLLSLSGTRHQLCGAAYGHGVYLSPSFDTSFSYANVGSDPVTIVAECEIDQAQNANPHYVIKDANTISLFHLIIIKK